MNSPLDLDFFTKRRLPMIHSAEAAECGLACMAMVARFHGQAVPLQPGMLVNADVVFDRRTLLQWLLDPLYAAGRR
jgi:hypothetical protein